MDHLRSDDHADCLLLQNRLRRCARRIRFRREEGKALAFLTNNFALPALTITALYRCRWQVEWFFNRINQHLRIMSFFGAPENVVKTQACIAIRVHVLVAIVRKRLKPQASLDETPQILSLTMFKTTRLHLFES